MQLFTDLVKDVSAVGNTPAMAVIGLLVLLYLFSRKDLLRIGLVILAYLSVLLNTVLKGIFMQERPLSYISSGNIPWNRFFVWEAYSFPSTHTVFYTVFFGYLFYLTCTLKGVDRILRHVVRLVSAVMVVTVGASRILLGAHFVRDVLAGYLFGVVYLTALIKLEIFLGQRQASKQPGRKKP